jgi:AcrR family transcriptional regulator
VRQGERTRARLLDAGARVLAERGYASTRVDDVVRVAETSRGTFYLYFRDKEDLFRTLATAAAEEMATLAQSLPPMRGDDAGRAALRGFLGDFLEVYERHGSVIRAWAENQIADRALVALGLDTFGRIAEILGDRMQADGDGLGATIFLATLERLVYFVTSRDLGLDADTLLDELAGMLHRAFFP